MLRHEVLPCLNCHPAAYQVDRIVPVLQEEPSHVLVHTLFVPLVAVGLVSDEQLHQACTD